MANFPGQRNVGREIGTEEVNVPSNRRMPPLGLAALAGLAQHAMARKISVSSGRAACAGVLTASSAGLLGASVLQFRRLNTTVNPVDPPQSASLVTTGVNGFSRNPMYVGMAGLLVAHAVLRGSWIGSLPVGGFILAIDRCQIPAEETALQAHFGEEYATYRARVPRWLGRVWWNPGST